MSLRGTSTYSRHATHRTMEESDRSDHNLRLSYCSESFAGSAYTSSNLGLTVTVMLSRTSRARSGASSRPPAGHDADETLHNSYW